MIEKNTYVLGKYLINSSSLNPLYADPYKPNKESCNFSITEGSKVFFKLHSDFYSCGDLTSVEYGKQLLLLVGDPFSGGNAYTLE